MKGSYVQTTMSSDPFPPSGSDPSSSSGTTPTTTDYPPASFQTTSLGLAPNVAAGLSMIMTFITGIVFLVLEKKNQFVRFWAMQAVFFGGSWLLFGILNAVLMHILGPLVILWVLVAMLINLGFVIVWIIGLVKAFTGQAWEIPILGKMARAQLANRPIL